MVRGRAWLCLRLPPRCQGGCWELVPQAKVALGAQGVIPSVQVSCLPPCTSVPMIPVKPYEVLAVMFLFMATLL